MSTRAVATMRPWARAVSDATIIPLDGAASSAQRSSTCPGGVNARTLTFVIRTGTSSGPVRCAAFGLERELDHLVQEQRRREDRAAREMVAEERRRLRVRASVAVADLPGTSAPGSTRKPSMPWKRPAGAPELQSTPKRSRSAAGESNSVSGSIGPRQSIRLERARAVDVGPAVIGDRVVVAALELDSELERLARLRVAQEPRLERERRHRPAAEVDVRHRDPRRELAHGLGDEARREGAGHGYGDRRTTRAPARPARSRGSGRRTKTPRNGHPWSVPLLADVAA